MEFAPIAKEMRCPGLAVDHRATEEKRRKMQRHLGASGASESFADTVSLFFLEVEQDTSALLQMDVVRAAEDRASQRISCKERATPILLKAGRQHKDSNWPSGYVSHSTHGESHQGRH